MSLTHGDDEHHNNTPSSQHILLYPYLSLSFVQCPAFVFAIVIAIAIVIIHPYSQGLHVRLRLLRVLAFVIVIDDSTVATVDTAAAH